jgi:hypothetical protein
MDTSKVAAAVRCPQHNIEANWPAIDICLKDLGCYSREVTIAALATIAVETAYKFEPIKEFGSEAYLRAKKYFPFFGRGYVQITWEENYRHYGQLLAIDLVGEPDRALNPNVAASILAAYFREHHIQVAAGAKNWTRVRELVNGGHNNLAEFLAIVAKLEEVMQ